VVGVSVLQVCEWFWWASTMIGGCAALGLRLTGLVGCWNHRR
jgi:hypothetical protein